MSDTTWLHMYVLAKDASKIEGIVGVPDTPFSYDESDKVLHLEYECANYGFATELRQMRDMGIPFSGYHGPGDDYVAQDFICDGETFSERPADTDGYLTARVTFKDGELVHHELDEIRAHFRLSLKVQALLGM